MTHIEKEETIISTLLQASANYHHQLCPRQVLGVRMGLYAGQLMGLSVPQKEKQLFTFIETDGCFLDGIAVSTGCTVGARTMRILDYGKIAATFVNRETGNLLRIIPNPAARLLCNKYASDATDSWHTYLFGYQEMPEDELFIVQPVKLTLSLAEIISRKTAKVICANCGEEIFNEREILKSGETLCKPCAGQRYYFLNDQLPKAQINREKVHP